MNIASIRRTDYNSILVREAEAQSYTNCLDMKKVIQSYINDNLMSDYYVKDIKEFTETRASKIDHDQYEYELAFVPVEIAMTLKEYYRDYKVIRIIHNDINNERNIIPKYSQKFKYI